MVAFDVETTRLIEEDVALTDMEVSVACAQWLPRARTVAEAVAAADRQTFWHTDVDRPPEGHGAVRPIRDMLGWFDAARVIVAYNGRAFDMQVLRRYYDGDDERWAAHVAKLHDPAEAVRRAAGRRVRLSTLLAANGLASKDGVGCDAPRLWDEGKLAQLERYCARDTSALVELVAKTEIRVAARTTTRGASVAHELMHAPPDEGSSSRDANGADRRRQREHDDGGSQPASTRPRHEPPAPRRGTQRERDEGHEVERRTAQRSAPSTNGNNASQHNERGGGEAPARGARHDDSNARAAGKRKAAQQPSAGQQEQGAAPKRRAARREPNDSGEDEEGGDDDEPTDAHAARLDEEADGSRRPLHKRTMAEIHAENPQANLDEDGREKRRRPAFNYDEVQRRGPRRAVEGKGHMDRGTCRGVKRGVATMIVGVATVDRVVQGRYNWRDRGMIAPEERQVRER